MSLNLLDNNSFLKSTVVVSAEAGAAEIISSALKYLKHSPICILEEPALSIFKNKIPNLNLKDISFLETLNPINNFVLLGSSYINDLERKAFKVLNNNKIPHASVFDQWINFDTRFGDPKKSLFPEQIWVTDNYAYQEAIKIGIDQEKLKIVNNYKFQEVQNDLQNLQPKYLKFENKGNILFLSEPISQDAQDRFGNELHYHFNEKTILSDILSLSISNSIRLRYHPADEKNKYDSMLSAKFHISNNKDLLEDIMWAETIIGIETIALVYATLAKRKAISFIPSQLYHCHLPHKEIIKVKEIVELKRILEI